MLNEIKESEEKLVRMEEELCCRRFFLACSMAEAVAVKLAIMATAIMNWLKGVDCEGDCVKSVGLVESGVSGRSGDAGDS